MKRFVCVFIALLMTSAQLSVFADTEYIPEGLKKTQQKYSVMISAAIENSEYDKEQIDKEHAFIIEHTSPMQMRKNEESIWLYAALPIIDSYDISYAHFDEGEYVSAVTNFAALKGTQKPYEDDFQTYLDENSLSTPSEITNLWVGEGVHVFAYKVVCTDKEYIIPYYITKDSIFNRIENDECDIEIGKAYTLDEFLAICETTAQLYDESRKSESKNDIANTYVDNKGDEVTTKIDNTKKLEKDIEATDKQKNSEEKPLSSGDPAHVYTFEELTGFSRDDIDHIVIRNGMDGVGYSTAYDKIISEIYTAINTKTFNVYIKDGNSDGWHYEVLFFDKNNSGYTYNISQGMLVKEKSGLTYRTSNEVELVKAVESAYKLIANDCSNWSCDYISEAKYLGFMDGVTDIKYKEAVTREKFCEIVYNMLDKTLDIKWKKVSPNQFNDTTNGKVSALYLEGIINGKGDNTFAPDDYLTREEAATIIVRVLNRFMPETPVTEMYFEYNDIDDVSEWASDSVQIISNLGIMNGVGDNSFAPQDVYTAEQAVVTVIRLCDKNNSVIQ